MKNLLFTSITILFLYSCNSSDSNNKQTETTPDSIIIENEKTLPADLTYKIISEKPNTALEKCNLDIELNRKLSEQELTTLAKKLHETRKSYKRLWIFYILPGMKPGSGAWATTHFTPELEVKILGSTLDEEQSEKRQPGNINGKVIGKWYENQYTSTIYILYENGSKIYLKSIYKDGSNDEYEMVKKNAGGGYRLDYKEDFHGEYFIVKKNGELGFFNKEGRNFRNAQASE